MAPACSGTQATQISPPPQTGQRRCGEGVNVRGEEPFAPFLINGLSSRNVDPLPHDASLFPFQTRFQALLPATPVGRS